MNTHLHIQTALRNGKTCLAKAYASSPLKVVDITEDRTRKGATAMIMSSSPGILDGDDYKLEVEVADGCSLRLETQSYQRLFTMTRGATQEMWVQLGQNTMFCYLPHPVVPHRNTVYKSVSKIFLSKNCLLVWGEVVTCGRKLNGEEFHFTSLHVIAEIFEKDKLVVKENMFLAPSSIDPLGMGLWEGHTHHASLIILGKAIDTVQLSNTILAMMEKETDVQTGVSKAPINGLVVRLLGYKAEQLHTCLKNIAALVTTVPSPNTNTYAW